MEMTTLGNTGLKVSRLGVGLAEIGYELSLSDAGLAEAGRVLNAALDGGINFLDTAACYGASEEMIGRTVSHRRSEFVLATKCGHGSGGYSDTHWTTQGIRDNIDRSLIRLNTDYLDLVHIHSCDVDVLKRGEVIEAVEEAKRTGKTRFIGYSGDNDAALWAIESGKFDTLETSFSIADQRARTKLFAPAKARGMGVIVKRPIANGAWGTEHSPSSYAAEYFRRAKAMAEMGPVVNAPENRILMAIGFVFAHPEVDTAIVGTRNSAHMLSNIDMVNSQLPVSVEAVEELRRRFNAKDDNWTQRD